MRGPAHHPPGMLVNVPLHPSGSELVDRTVIDFLASTRLPLPSVLAGASRGPAPPPAHRSAMAAITSWALKLYSPLAVALVMVITLSSRSRPLVPQILDNLQATALWCVAGINLLTGYVALRLHMSASLDVSGFGGKVPAALAAAGTLAVLTPPQGEQGETESGGGGGAGLDPRTPLLPRYRAELELELGPVFTRHGAPALPQQQQQLQGRAGASTASSSAALPTDAEAALPPPALPLDETITEVRVLPPIVLADGTILPPTVLGQGAPDASAAAALPSYYAETRHGWMVRALLALVPTDCDCFSAWARSCRRWRRCRAPACACAPGACKRAWLYACPCTRACCTDEGCTASEGKTASFQTLVLASTAALVVSGIFLPFVGARVLPSCAEHVGSLALLLFPGGSALLLGSTTAMGFGRKLRQVPVVPGSSGGGGGAAPGSGSAAESSGVAAEALPVPGGETPATAASSALTTRRGSSALALPTTASASASAATFLTAWRTALRSAVLAELPSRLAWVRLLATRSAALTALYGLLTVPLLAGALEASPIPGLDGSARPTAGLDVGRSTGVLFAVCLVPLAIGAGLARASATPPGSAASAARVCQAVPVKGTGLSAFLSRVSSMLFAFARLVPVPLTQPLDVAGFYDVVRHPATRAAFTGVPGCPGAQAGGPKPRTGLMRLLLGPSGEGPPRPLSSYPLLAICCVAVLSPAQWRHRLRFVFPASARLALRQALCGVPATVPSEAEPNLYMAWWAWLERAFNVESCLNFGAELLTWIALAMVLGNAPAEARNAVVSPDFTAPATSDLGPCPTGITWAMRVPLYQYAAVSCIILAYSTALACWMVVAVARPSRPGAAVLAAANGGGGAVAGAAKALPGAPPHTGAMPQLAKAPGSSSYEAVSAVTLQSALVFALTLPRKSLGAGLCLAWALLGSDLGGAAADTAAGDTLYRFRVQIAAAYGVYHVISGLYIAALQALLSSCFVKHRLRRLHAGVDRGAAAKAAAARAGVATGFTAAVRAKVAERALSRLKQHRSSIASVATTSRSITSRLTLGDVASLGGRGHPLAGLVDSGRLPQRGPFSASSDGFGSDGGSGSEDVEGFPSAVPSARRPSGTSTAAGGGGAGSSSENNASAKATAAAVVSLPSDRQPTTTTSNSTAPAEVKEKSSRSGSVPANLLATTAAAAAAAASLSTAMASRPGSVRLSLPKLAPLPPLPAGLATGAAASAPAPAPAPAAQPGGAPPPATDASAVAAALQAALPSVVPDVAAAPGATPPLELLKLKEAAAALTSYVDRLTAALPAPAPATVAAPVGGGPSAADKPAAKQQLDPVELHSAPVVAAAPPHSLGGVGAYAGPATTPAPQLRSAPAAGAATTTVLPLADENDAFTATVYPTTPVPAGALPAATEPVPASSTHELPLPSGDRLLSDMSVPVPIKVETPATRSRKLPKRTHTSSEATTTAAGAPTAAGRAVQPFHAHATLGPRLSSAPMPLGSAPQSFAASSNAPVMKASVSLAGAAGTRRGGAPGQLEAVAAASTAATAGLGGQLANPYAYRPEDAAAAVGRPRAVSGTSGGAVSLPPVGSVSAVSSSFSNPFAPSGAARAPSGVADDSAVRKTLENTMALIAASYSPAAGTVGRSRKAGTVKAAAPGPSFAVPPHAVAGIVHGGAEGLGLHSDIAASLASAPGGAATAAAPAAAPRAAPAPVHRSIAGDLILRRDGAPSSATEPPLYKQYLPQAALPKVSEGSSVTVGAGRRTSDGAVVPGSSATPSGGSVPPRAAAHPAPKSAFGGITGGALY